MLVAKKRMPQLATPGFVSCTASKFVWAGVRQRQTSQNTLFFTTKKKFFLFTVRYLWEIIILNWCMFFCFCPILDKLNHIKCLLVCKKKNAPASDTVNSFPVQLQSSCERASDSVRPCTLFFTTKKNVFFATVRYLWEIIILNWCMFFCFYTWNWIN